MLAPTPLHRSRLAVGCAAQRRPPGGARLGDLGEILSFLVNRAAPNRPQRRGPREVVGRVRPLTDFGPAVRTLDGVLADHCESDALARLEELLIRRVATARLDSRLAGWVVESLERSGGRLTASGVHAPRSAISSSIA